MDRGGRGSAMAQRAVARTMALVLALASGTALAVPLIDRGTWYGTDGTDGTLRGRDASGTSVSLLVSGVPNPAIKFVYDTVLDLTWLANWNAGAGTTFDNGSSTTDGRMTWANAKAWATSLTDFGGRWALPTVRDIGNDGCNYSNFGTDCGVNVYGSEQARRASPLAHMYYDTLGNLGVNDSGGNFVPGFGLENGGPFTNLLPDVYWSATAFTPNADEDAWLFYFHGGIQGSGRQVFDVYSTAVRPGDVALVPEDSILAMLLVGLGTLAVARRRRRSA